MLTARLASVSSQERAVAGRGGMLGETLRRLAQNRGAVAGAIVLVVMALVAVTSPYLAPYDPLEVAPEHALAGPSLDHLMGMDENGRDLLSRVMVGSRISLQVGLISTSISVLFGITLGLLAGYRGGLVGIIIMRTVDVMLAVPGILLAMVIVAGLGPSIFNVMIAIGISGIPRFTRVVRGSVLSAKENVYVEAARAIGCPGMRIAVRHILPNVFAPALVLGTLYVAGAILGAASLSFLGMGAQPPTPEWGLILSKGREYIRAAWWITAFPGLAIMLAVLSINMLGDGLRDALDPRLRV